MIPMPKKRVRKCGFQRPFSTDQIITWVLQIPSFIIFLVASSFLEDEQLLIVHCVHDPLLLVFIVIYVILGLMDPSKESSMFFCGKKETTSLYCRYCQKRIPGFDHHCTWLNTCIGRRNYIFFYTLATLGSILQIIEIVYTLLMIIVWYDTHTVWRVVLLSIYCVLPVAALISYGSLWSFHTYTLCRKITTYQYLNRNRKSNIHDSSNNKLSEEYKSAIEKRNRLERQQWENQHSSKNNSKSEGNMNAEEKTVDTVATNNTSATQSAGDIIINIKDKSESDNMGREEETKKEIEQPKNNQTSPEVVIEIKDTPSPPPTNNNNNNNQTDSSNIEQTQQGQFHSNTNSPVKNSMDEEKEDIKEDDIELKQEQQQVEKNPPTLMAIEENKNESNETKQGEEE